MRSTKGATILQGLPRPSYENPKPLPMEEVILLVPDFDPMRDAGDCVFDAGRAEEVIDFFHECLTHVKGKHAGKPLVLELWQQAIIANVFGWLRTDGTRRFRHVFIFVPRKNGKTTMVSGLVLFMLFCDGEQGAEVYSAAADKDQASLIFQQAKEMTEHESELSQRGKVYRALKSIEFGETASFYRAISSESNTKHGYNSSCFVVDELHAQKDRDLVDVLDTSTGSREQPLAIYITTSDFDGPSICNEKLEYAEAVCEGTVNDSSFLPVLYRADDDDPWDEPETWAKANPNLGVSVGTEYIEAKCKQAQNSSAFLNTFKRLHLNIKTQADVAWVDLRAYDACAAEWSLEEMHGYPCFGGLDLASNSDLTAFVLFWPGFLRWAAWFWCPKETALLRSESKKLPYLHWAEDPKARLALTPGTVCDYGVVRRDILALADLFDIGTVCYDRWSAALLVQQLEDEAVDMAPFGQGYASMSNPMKEVERLIIGGEGSHDGDPLLRWNVGNVMAALDDAGNTKPSKKKSKEKIDGAVALIMAVGASQLEQVESAYNERGILTL